MTKKKLAEDGTNSLGFGFISWLVSAFFHDLGMPTLSALLFVFGAILFLAALVNWLIIWLGKYDQ